MRWVHFIDVRGFACAIVLAAAGACALNRPQVKGLRDRDAGRIAFDETVTTTITALNALRSACGPATNHRIRDEEFRVYEVVGRITRVKREHDHDVHIVLADPERPADRIIVESGDPDYHGNAHSPNRERIRAGRRDFEALVARSGVHGVSELNGILVRVRGVGFFDMNHLQIGRSRSCIELHPIISISEVRTAAQAITDH
jgi:hypothetical protein